MVLKLISFIIVTSLAFGITSTTQMKDVNEVIGRASHHQQVKSRIPDSEFQQFDQGEFLIDTSIVWVNNPGDQSVQSSAFDGTNYFVVWRDSRNGNDDIYGARVNQFGIVLDPNGIGITTAEGDQSCPAIVFDGTNYLVVWEHWNEGDGFGIYCARVSQLGMLLDTNSIIIATAQYGLSFPSVAFDGYNYLVVWQDMRNDTLDIYGARVTQAGIVLDPYGIAISLAPGDQWVPSVSFDGTNYLVVWEDWRNGESDIYGCRVNQSGVVLDPQGFVVSNAMDQQETPVVIFGGNYYLAVWEDGRNGAPDIYGARISRTGSLLDPNGIAVSTAMEAQWFASISFDGINFLITWGDYRDSCGCNIYGARMNQAGVVLDPDGINISPDNRGGHGYPAMAFDGNNYLITWTDERGSRDIYASRLTQAGIVLDTGGFDITTATNRQDYPKVAFDGTNYLIVWQSEGNDRNIKGARINEAGIILDPRGFGICTKVRDQWSPKITFGGTNYLVVWEDDRNNDTTNIYCARVNPAGFVLDTGGLAVCALPYIQSYPCVAFDGINYLVVWADRRNNEEDIYGTRINQAGIVLDTGGFAISTAISYQVPTSVAFDGTNYLVAWVDWRQNQTLSDIYCARVNQSGIVLDTNGIPVSTEISFESAPAVAFDGINYFIAWGVDRLVTQYDLRGARVSQAGVVIDTEGIDISIAPDDQDGASVVYDGSNYLVIWEDCRNGQTDIYGAIVNIFGKVIDSFPIVTQNGEQYYPALACGVGNQIILTYSGWASEYQGRTYNTYRVWGKFYPFVPRIEEVNSKVKMQSAKLLEVYPNPFSKQTAIRFAPYASRIELKIYDITGKLVKSFFSNNQSLTTNNFLIWYGTDDSGESVPPGVYCIRLITQNSSSVARVVRER